MISRLLALLLLVPASAGAVVIDRIAATIDREVITLSEVNQLIEIRLFVRDGGETDEAFRRRVLDSLIAQALRYRDVTRYGAEDVPADSVEARLRELEARFASPEEFVSAVQRTELTLDEVRALIKRQLQVNAYIEERYSPTIFVSIEEIETYYNDTWLAQRAQRGLPPLPLAQVREEIRSLLKAERLEAEIDRWTGQLRSRSNVDVYIYR